MRNEGEDLYSIEFDVMDIIADAQARGYGLNVGQLNGVAVGFEIWNGPVSNIRTTDFYVNVK